MAKGNMFLGMARGKVGDVVMYRQNGQQMARVRTRVVKNPKTSGQQIQRMIQATAAYAYAGLKTIVDHSFEGIQYGGKSMNYFMKRNMDLLRAQAISAGNGQNISARFAAPNIRVLYPNNYIVSNGSLAPLPDANSTVSFGGIGAGLCFNLTLDPGMTFGELMAATGSSAGDQLTFLFLNKTISQDDAVATIGSEKAYAIALAVRRLKFKDSYTEQELAKQIFDIDDKDEYYSLFDMSVSSDDVIISAMNSELNALVPSFNGYRIIVGGCCIRSRKIGDSWLRSPQTIFIDDNVISDNNIGFTITTAYNAWTSGVTSVGVSEYILNGKPNTNVWPIIDDDSESGGDDSGDEENP